MSRSPSIACESPSAASSDEQSSSRRCRARYAGRWAKTPNCRSTGCVRVLKVSASSSRANRPRRLTQGPRLVETVTSGEMVTMRSARSPARARKRVEQRAEPRLRGDPDRRAPRSAACAGAPSRAGFSPATRRSEWHVGREIVAARRLDAPRPRRLPLMRQCRIFIALAQGRHLRLGHQTRHGCPYARRTAAPSP